MYPPPEEEHLSLDAPAHPVDRGTTPATDAAADARAGTRLLVVLAIAAVPMPLATLFGLDPDFGPAAYLPVHTIAEFLIAFVGLATFAVQWYAAQAPGVREARGRLLGAAALGMAALEVCHALVFPGMPGLFGPPSVERGIHYWLAARACMTGALVASAFVDPADDRPLLRRGPLAGLFLAGVAAFVLVEARLPPAHGWLHVPGEGLTTLKIALEGVLAAAAGAGAVLHLRRHRATGDATLLRTAAALGWLVLASACLSLYAHAYDLFNLLGHVYAGASSWLIFHALFVAALLRPYERLDGTTRALASANARLEALRAHVEGELARTIARLEEASASEAKAREELEAAVAAVPDGIVRYAPDGAIRSMNAGAERILGYPVEVRGRPLAERWAALQAHTTAGAPLPLEENPIFRALGGEVVQGVPLVLRTPAGKARWVNVSAAPIGGPEGGAVAVITDVSELQQLQAEREDLLRAVSHDLRNPLQIVLLQAERIQRLAPPDGRERRSAETIAASARHMGVMIRDLVEAVRLDAGSLVLRPERLDLAAWIPERLTMAAGVLDVGRVVYEFEPGLPPASADASRLERVVTNLVSNALRYSSAPAPVRVAARREGGELVVEVEDRGVGVHPEDVPRLFQRFQRGRRTSRTEGLGLGLYIVRTLVEAHGGRVFVRSAPGEGSTFGFTLPLANG